METFVDNRIDLFRTSLDNLGPSPFEVVITATGSLDVIKFLMDQGFKIWKYDMYHSALNNKKEILDFFMGLKNDRAMIDGGLRGAMEGGHVDLLRRLEDKYSITPTHSAHSCFLLFYYLYFV